MDGDSTCYHWAGQMPKGGDKAGTNPQLDSTYLTAQALYTIPQTRDQPGKPKSDKFSSAKNNEQVRNRSQYTRDMLCVGELLETLAIPIVVAQVALPDST